MQLILLSGGSGTRLWPLSNDARSKQFLKLLPVPGTDRRESMIQRVVRQIRESSLDADLTVATGANQRDSVVAQLGSDVDIVVEPSRRNTFPAICLACEYLSKQKHCPDNETVVVMPCDPYTDAGYYDTIREMAEAEAQGQFSLMVMGITPTYPSAKYGYLLPSGSNDARKVPIASFVEKPSVARAEELIAQGAKWNGGVFAFRLGFLLNTSRRYVDGPTFDDILSQYDKFPKISFDYEVAEKTPSIGMVSYTGPWKDLGTWNTLTDELPSHKYGNVTVDDTVDNTHIINELGIPILCIGTKDLVVAASPDGIIVTEKAKSENVREYADRLKTRPMYEERRWGTYRVLQRNEFPDGYCVLVKELMLNPGCSISYQRHSCRDEVWTFVDGEGEIMLDGERRPVRRGDTFTILRGQLHALRATTSLTFIEVQRGANLIEEDIERFPLTWDKD